MSDEEFASDEILFGPSLRLNLSHELDLIEDIIQGEHIGEETAPNDLGQGAAVIAESGSASLPTGTELPTEDDGEEEEEEVVQRPKAKRNTTSYAKKLFIAKNDLFLDSIYYDKVTDNSIEIVGQVDQCPRATNGKQYKLTWKEPIPKGIERSWLRTYLVGSGENKARLLTCIQAYEERPENAQKKAARKRSFFFLLDNDTILCMILTLSVQFR
jgi:hypothetical protein